MNHPMYPIYKLFHSSINVYQLLLKYPINFTMPKMKEIINQNYYLLISQQIPYHFSTLIFTKILIMSILLLYILIFSFNKMSLQYCDLIIVVLYILYDVILHKVPKIILFYSIILIYYYLSHTKRIIITHKMNPSQSINIILSYLLFPVKFDFLLTLSLDYVIMLIEIFYLTFQIIKVEIHQNLFTI